MKMLKIGTLINGVELIMENKICKKCNKEISKNEKGVTWITFKGNKKLEVIHWHFQCFLDWKNKSIENKAKVLYSATMEKVIPQAKGMINKILNIEEEQIIEV